jgi:thiamine-phosphate pyrophosphorylase
MLLIVLSPPESTKDEHKTVISLFNHGLEIFHLRKPGYSFNQMEDYIRAIPVEFHPRMMIHSHYELAGSYNLKGIHLTEKARNDVRIKKLLRTFTNKRISASFHQLGELKQSRRKYDYVFLSPIFDSISKNGYKGKFDLQILSKSIASINMSHQYPPKIVALGGIANSNVHCIKEIGFSGIAVLGAVWNNSDPAEAFNAIQRTVNQL